MKIVAKSTTAAADSVQSLPAILGDDTKKDYIADFLPEEARTVQPKGGYQQGFKSWLDRNNITRQVTWTVDRVFETNAKCDLFVRDHADRVPTNCDIEVTVAVSTKTYTGCYIDHIKCILHKGPSCVFQYHAFLGPVS